MAFRVEEKVRFRDIDGMGHVNNAVYFSYLETARTEYYMSLTGVRRLEDMEFILARACCDFRSAAEIGETVVIEVWPTKIGETSFALAYRLTEKASGRLLAEADSVQVAYDYRKREKRPIPPDLCAKLEAELRSAAQGM